MCGTEGYRARDCSRKASDCAAVTHNDGAEKKSTFLALATGLHHGQLGKYDFVVDNAAPCGHTARHREMFTEYTPVNNCTVRTPETNYRSWGLEQ